MKKKLNRKKKIVLYGAGQKSHSVYRALILSGYTIAYCVVTNNAIEESEFEEVKVYAFEKKKDEILEKGYQIVIASFQKFEIEIAEVIESSGIKDYWKLSEMPWSVNFEEYRVLDKEGYIEIIKQKYYKDREKYKKQEVVRNYIEKSNKQPVDNKKITFLLLVCAPRSYKIINALHHKGYYIEIIMWGNAMYLTQEKCDEYFQIADEYRLCIDAEEVMMYCSSTNSKILHIFSEINSNIELPRILINCKSLFPKIVFDEYDVVAEMQRGVSEELIESELFCLENADGLCNRYRCMEYLETKGYKICSKRIHFIDCCNDSIKYESPQKSAENELNLVHVGTVLADNAYETSKVARLLEFGLRCKENKVHLHIYPVSYDTAKLTEYIKMEKINPYFHLHPSVSIHALPQEISKYDYGVFCAQNGFLDHASEKGGYRRESLIFCEANRFYDFLDAGLPVVAAIPVEQTKMFEKDGVLLRKTDEEIDFDELRQKRNELKRKVIQIRDKYRISNQLSTLIELYDDL